MANSTTWQIYKNYHNIATKRKRQRKNKHKFSRSNEADQLKIIYKKSKQNHPKRNLHKDPHFRSTQNSHALKTFQEPIISANSLLSLATFVRRNKCRPRKRCRGRFTRSVSNLFADRRVTKNGQNSDNDNDKVKNNNGKENESIDERPTKRFFSALCSPAPRKTERCHADYRARHRPELAFRLANVVTRPTRRGGGNRFSSLHAAHSRSVFSVATLSRARTPLHLHSHTR